MTGFEAPFVSMSTTAYTLQELKRADFNVKFRKLSVTLSRPFILGMGRSAPFQIPSHNPTLQPLATLLVVKERLSGVMYCSWIRQNASSTRDC